MTNSAAYLLQEYLNAAVVLKPHREAIDPLNWEEGEAILNASKTIQSEILLLAIEQAAKNSLELRRLRERPQGQYSPAFARLAGENPALSGLAIRLSRRRLLESPEALEQAVASLAEARIFDSEFPYKVVIRQLQLFGKKQTLTATTANAFHHWRSDSRFQVVSSEGLDWVKRLDEVLNDFPPSEPPKTLSTRKRSISDEAAFVEEILDHPDELGPRQVYADWLVDRGDPRADLLLLENECEQHSPADAVYARLRSQWTRQLKKFLARSPDLPDDKHGPRIVWGGHRGGLIQATISPPTLFAERAEELFENHPAAVLLHVHSGNYYQTETGVRDAERVAHCASWSRVAEASLPDPPEILSPLLSAAPWSRLRALRVRLTDPRLAPELAGNARFCGLRELLLTSAEKFGASFGSEAREHEDLVAIAKSPHLRPRTLAVIGLQQAGAASQLLGSPVSSALERLHLQGVGVNDADLKKLVAWPRSKKLTLLNLHGNQLGESEMRTLIRDDAFPALTHLDLSANPLCSNGVARLMEAPWLKSVQSLHLVQCGISRRGIEALLESPHLTELRQLDLRGNSLKPNALEALSQISSKRLPHLWRVVLDEANITPARQSELKKLAPPLVFAPSVHPRDRR